MYTTGVDNNIWQSGIVIQRTSPITYIIGVDNNVWHFGIVIKHTSPILYIKFSICHSGLVIKCTVY